MRSWHGFGKGAAAAGLAALIAGAGVLLAGAPPAGASPRPAAAASTSAASNSAASNSVASTSVASKSAWRARSLARIGAATDVAVDPSANVAFETVSRAGGDAPFRLERLALGGTKKVVRGPEFPVSQVSVAAGYAWVSGPAVHGFHLRLFQVRISTLTVVRSWYLPGGAVPDFRPVPVTAGPAGTAWIGFGDRFWRLNVRTGARSQRRLPSASLTVTDVAMDPAAAHLYVSAAPKLGGAVVFEYSLRSSKLVATAKGKPLEFSVSGAELTAAPHGVWASFRTGMAGQTVLLRQQGLHLVHVTGGATLFGWFMLGSTVYGGGSTWVGLNNGDMGCVGPSTGAVRSRGHLRLLAGGGELLGVSAARREVYALGTSSILGITAPSTCWR
jgi:hypothetical protein